jgi:archaellin
MAWLPISGTIPQYSTAANALAGDYWLKFYESGTATPTNMATDATGATELAKCKLSSDGYPISNSLDETTRFIPHIDKNYRIVLYTNEIDADNNATANAAFNIDGMVLQVTPTANAENITLRDTTIAIQDDYDRSPLFVDGDGFTAGAGPHVITVPSDWTPTNADMRFYRVDNSGIVTALTPTSTSSTTFTLAETLLSTDVIFIGDDNFRNVFEGDPQANFEAIKQSATESFEGVVEEATAAEMTAGTGGKFPDAATVKGFVDDTLGDYATYSEVTVPSLNGDFTAGSLKISKIGNTVTVTATGQINHASLSLASSASGLIPSGYRPVYEAGTVSSSFSSNTKYWRIQTDGALSVINYDWAGSLFATTFGGGFTITYVI